MDIQRSRDDRMSSASKLDGPWPGASQLQAAECAAGNPLARRGWSWMRLGPEYSQRLAGGLVGKHAQGAGHAGSLGFLVGAEVEVDHAALVDFLACLAHRGRAAPRGVGGHYEFRSQRVLLHRFLIRRLESSLTCLSRARRPAVHSPRIAAFSWIPAPPSPAPPVPVP